MKIWASKHPLVILLSLPIGCYLFVFELFHVERVTERLAVVDAAHTLPLLFFATWKTLLFQAVMLAFTAFWTTVDSQYGMIRVGTCQPVTRVAYLLGKWLGISGHVAVFTVVFVASLLAWSVFYSGIQGMQASDWLAIARFGMQVLVFSMTMSVVAGAASSFRRTVGAGMVTALIAVIGLAFMTMLPFDVLSPRFVLMRFFGFPLGELPNPFPNEADSSFVRIYTVADFYRVAALTPLCFVIPAVMYFQRRDIRE